MASAFKDVSLDSSSDIPLYRQLADSIGGLIARGVVREGERLPPTRELAAQLGLNRTTVSAAYAQLENSRLIHGHVGRGSFVAATGTARTPELDWESILPRLENVPASPAVEISFASSRPAQDAFPLDAFRRLAKEVVDSTEAPEILQLGSPHGYAPLRRYLLQQAAAEGIARPGDDLIVTNGCQQALDLLSRLFASTGQPIVIEDPMYYGLFRAFSRAGGEIIPVPVGDHGIDPDALEAVFVRQRPRAVLVTPSFQNPTGATMPLEARRRIVDLARRNAVVLIESDIYSELRYKGTALPTLKQLDKTGNTILLRSYSKISFPGLRVGWVIAPRAVTGRLAEAKQTSDLHSDQLSQAVLLRFAQSGELERHLAKTRQAGLDRLQTALRACAEWLPAGTRFTRPEGGMSLWIELPAPLNAQELLPAAQKRGVNFLPGGYFSAQRAHAGCLRLSFGGLPAADIERGIRAIGETARQALSAANSQFLEPVPALV